MKNSKKLLSVLLTVIMTFSLIFVGLTTAFAATGAAVTGLDVPANVLQLGETTIATAATAEVGTVTWTSSDTAVATVDGNTGVVTALTAGTTTIAYTASPSTNTNSTVITVYAAAAVANPTIGVVQVGAGDVTPTGFTAAGAGETIAWVSSDMTKATMDGSTGVITPVAAGDTTISYTVVETATGKIVAKGSLAITVNAADVEITTFDAIANVDAGTAGSASYADATAVQAVLPTTATANTNAVTVPVTAWIDTDTYNPAVAGSYTFTATLGAIPAGFANTGNFTATVEVVVAPVTLSSIAITTPATKLVYTVGEALDISGMEVTGTYSDGSTAAETIISTDVAGFDSSAPAVDQVLTITVGGKTTTYTVTINAAPVTPAAPSVTNDDTANTVTGMTTAMEYKLDDAGYVAYDAITFDAIDLSGEHTLLVRVAAEGINPAGLDTTLAFTTALGEDKKVASITGNNILLVGSYAFDLSDSANNNYNLNNFLVAANTAYSNPIDTYHVYFRIGDTWYDIASDPTMATPISASTINVDGLFNYMNMQ